MKKATGFLFFLFFLLPGIVHLHAQKKNQLSMYTGNYKYYGNLAQLNDPFSVLGGRYSRSLTKRITVFTAYNRLPMRTEFFVVEQPPL